MTPQQQSTVPTRIGFLLVEKFSMIAVSSAIEPLRMANRLADQTLYEWPVITLDGEAVYASNGLTIPPNHSIYNMPPVDILFICSGVEVSGVYSKELEKFLCKLDRQKS